MLINSIDIKNFKARQLTVNIDLQELNNDSQWLDHWLSPLFFKNKPRLKKIDLELLFEGNSRDEIYMNMSNFMSKLIDKVILTLDGYSHKYDVILTENSTEKTESSSFYKKKLTFVGYEFSTEITETINRITNKTINVTGNMETPAIVEIIPSIELIDLTITGLDDKPIILKNLKSNTKLILDGETCTVTANGISKFSDTNMWGFPKLKPGANTITVDKSSVDITVKYKPRYM